MKRPQNVGDAATRLATGAASKRPKSAHQAEAEGGAAKRGGAPNPAPAKKGPAETPKNDPQKASTAKTRETKPEAATPPTEAMPSSSGSAGPSVRAAARRRKRYERAEVKRFTRSARRRRRAWLIGTAVVVLVLAGTALIPLSPLMAVHTIDVEGTQRLSASQVRTALDPELGTPLALVNQRSIETRLSAFPLVRSFSTQVEPPGTLIVHIVERTPLLLLKKTTAYQLVDQAGVVIDTSRARPAGYPLLTVPAKTSASAAANEFAAAADVLAELPASVLAQVATVTATDSQDVTFLLRSGKTVVWGGPEQSEQKAAALAAMLKGVPNAQVYDVSAPSAPVSR